MDAFVIMFRSPGQLQAWRNQIEILVKRQRDGGKSKKSSSVRDSMQSGDTTFSHSGYSSTTAASSTFSKHSRTTMSSLAGSKDMDTLEEEPHNGFEAGLARYARPGLSESMTTLRSPQFTNQPIPYLPHDFPSIDLMLIFAVPAPTNAPSSYQLKIRLIKSTLDFVVNNIGPRGRISIVTYNCDDGVRGSLRKTPLLAVGRDDSKQRLQAFINELGNDGMPGSDGRVDSRDERINVVTAVNLGASIPLQ